jgi:hypothetical protein
LLTHAEAPGAHAADLAPRTVCPFVRLDGRRGANRWARAVTGVLLLALSGCGSSRYLSKDESITFQPGPGYQINDGHWVVEVRASVYRESWLNDIEPMMMHWLESHKFVAGSAEEKILNTRLSLFLFDHPAGKTLSVRAGDRTCALSPSDASGRVLSRIVLTEQAVNAIEARQSDGHGWLTFQLRTDKDDSRTFTCRAQILRPRGLCVISDIDDTIKITDVNNTTRMLKNTFCYEFKAVPGMAAVFSTWAKDRGAALHYLSASPLELHEPLSEFMDKVGFPAGTMDLRQIDWGGSRLKGFMAIMEAPQEFKIGEIRRLIDALPDRDYVLVGDSGQHDPEVYAAIARLYPKQVQRIFIRDVTCEDPSSPRYQETFAGLPGGLLRTFRDPAEILDAIPEKW